MSIDQELTCSIQYQSFLIFLNLSEGTFQGVYVSTQYINIVSLDQELMCSIQFQSFLFFLDLPDGIF
jgi:hypothetical protein